MKWFNKNKIMTPKYKVGDIVFILDYGKVVSRPITGVFRTSGASGDIIRYYTGVRDTVTDYGWIKEADIFPSKEELLKSL